MRLVISDVGLIAALSRCSKGLGTKLCRAISGPSKQSENRSLAVSTGHVSQSGGAPGRSVITTFQAGHASSILVTRSTMKALIRAILGSPAGRLPRRTPGSGHYGGPLTRTTRGICEPQLSVCVEMRS